MATYFKYRRSGATYSSLLFTTADVVGKNLGVRDTSTKYVQLLPVAEATGSYMRARHSGVTYAVATSNGYDTATLKTSFVTTPAASKVVYGNGKFVALVVSLTETYAVSSSDNGATWTKRTISTLPRTWITLAYVNNLFIALHAGTTLFTSTDAVTWSEKTLPAQTSTWKDVSYVTGRYIAIPSTGTAGATSTDGNTWTSITMPASLNWYAIASNGTTFVLAANNTSCYRTTDGVTWTAATSGGTAATAISYGNSAFILYNTSTTAAAVSTDGGVNFTAIAAPTASNSSLVYGSSWVFLSNYNVYTSSNNGTSWTIQSLSDVDSDYTTIAWSGTYYVIVSDYTRVSNSTNGTAWSVVGATDYYVSTNRLYNVSPVNNYHVLCGNDGRLMLTSSDAITWTDRLNSMMNAAAFSVAGNGTDQVVCWAIGNGANSYYVSTDWKFYTASGGIGQSNYKKLIYGGGTYCAVGAYYSAYSTTYNALIYTSTNGTSWTSRAITSTSAINSVGYGGTGVFVVPMTGASCYTSTDYGATWATKTMPGSATWAVTAYGNSIWVMLASGTTAASTSADGLTWSAMTMPVAPATWTGIAYGAGVFVAVSMNTNSIYYSSTGLTGSWTAVDVATTSVVGWQSVSFANGKFCLAGYNNFAIAYSSNGSSWTVAPMDKPLYSNLSTNSTSNLEYLNSKYLFFQNNVTSGCITCFSSSDSGTTWTGNLIKGESSSFVSAIYQGGKYYITSNSGISYSTNLISWTTVSPAVSTTWRAIGYGNGKFLAVSSTNNIAATSTDGTTWTPFRLPYVNNASLNLKFLYYGAHFIGTSVSMDGIIMSSNNGTSWVRNAGLPANGEIAYGAGIYVVLGTGTTTNYVTSTDGTTWTTRSTLPSAPWISVSFGNGIFLAVSSSATAATSTDGINWTTRTVPTSPMQKVKNNGSYFLVIGTTTTAYTTTDGITWTTKTLLSSIISNANIAWNGTTWLLLGPSTSAWTSADATTWAAQTLPVTASSCINSGSNFVMLAAASGTASYYSTTGATGSWTLTTLPATSSWSLLASNGANIVASGVLEFAYSSNSGVTWSTLTYPTLSNDSGFATAKIAYYNGVWLIIKNKDTFNFSTNDMSSWSTSSAVNGAVVGWYFLAYGNGIFMASTGGYVSTSPDGNTWTARTNFPYTVSSLTYGNGFFWATKYNSGAPNLGGYKSRDGVTWEELPGSIKSDSTGYAKIAYNSTNNNLLLIGSEEPGIITASVV